MVDQFGHYKVLDRLGRRRGRGVPRARHARGAHGCAQGAAGAISAPAERETPPPAARAPSAGCRIRISRRSTRSATTAGRFSSSSSCPGRRSSTLIAGRPLNPRRAVDLAAQIADALAEAHAAGIAHGAHHGRRRHRHAEGTGEDSGFRADRVDQRPRGRRRPRPRPRIARTSWRSAPSCSRC